MTVQWIMYTAKFHSSNLHGTKQLPDHGMFQFFRHYLHWHKLLQVIFCYCTYTSAALLIRGVFHWDLPFICWFRVIRVLLCVFWSLQSWRSWCSRKKGSEYITIVDVQTISEAFSNTSLKSACFINETFFW